MAEKVMEEGEKTAGQGQVVSKETRAAGSEVTERVKKASGGKKSGEVKTEGVSLFLFLPHRINANMEM